MSPGCFDVGASKVKVLCSSTSGTPDQPDRTKCCITSNTVRRCPSTTRKTRKYSSRKPVPWLPIRCSTRTSFVSTLSMFRTFAVRREYMSPWGKEIEFTFTHVLFFPSRKSTRAKSPVQLIFKTASLAFVSKGPSSTATSQGRSIGNARASPFPISEQLCGVQ